ncbi:MAG: hypothetical protein A2X32_04060 [Elusimicrobia bacterium GWC2_64_44]|nr:MAG: hypothetical protein A2X32_04060 [Elusimicrobia bacterium GWC2_64_44]
MKKVMIALIAVFAAASSALAAENTMAGLSSAGDAISAVDMKKDFGKAGSILDGFFSGAAAKQNSVAAFGLSGSGASTKAGPGRNIYGQTAEQLINAKPARKVLASSVKQITAVAAQTKGAGGSSWTDDLNTVVDYVVDGIHNSLPKPPPSGAVCMTPHDDRPCTSSMSW